jgi:hypothetical protein
LTGKDTGGGEVAAESYHVIYALINAVFKRRIIDHDKKQKINTN